MIRYTALGDSITAGEAATRQNLSYPNLVVSMLAGTRKQEHVIGQILAEPGWTSLALEHAVMQNSPSYLALANVITIWVGGDDLAYAALAELAHHNPYRISQAIRLYGIHLSTLLNRILAVSKATMIVFTQYNPFPNSAMAAIGIDTLNNMTESVCAQHGVILAPSHEWFAGRESELIYGYRTGRIEDVARTLPIHPNNLGHKVIAKELYRIIQSTSKPM